MRWLQRLDSFRRACNKMSEIQTIDLQNLTELEKEGFIQRFEYTYELSWKVMQDYLRSAGYTFMAGPNGTIRQALEAELIDNQEGWRNMSAARNTTNNYDYIEVIDDIVNAIYNFYYLFKSLLDKLTQISQR